MQVLEYNICTMAAIKKNHHVVATSPQLPCLSYHNGSSLFRSIHICVYIVKAMGPEATFLIFTLPCHIFPTMRKNPYV